MPTERFSRRGLGRRAALAVAVGASKDAPAAPQRGGPPLDPAGQAEVDSKLANVVRLYGSRLSDDQKTRVRNVLGQHQRMLSRVRAFHVENSDSPATGLRLYPNDTAVPKKG